MRTREVTLVGNVVERYTAFSYSNERDSHLAMPASLKPTKGVSVLATPVTREACTKSSF